MSRDRLGKHKARGFRLAVGALLLLALLTFLFCTFGRDTGGIPSSAAFHSCGRLPVFSLAGTLCLAARSIPGVLPPDPPSMPYEISLDVPTPPPEPFLRFSSSDIA